MNDRRNAINAYIQTNGDVSLTQLQELWPEVSSMTLRRDLEYLENEGELIRIRGGARSVAQITMQKEHAYSARALVNLENKTIIAQKALTFISGEIIYLDAGTTTMCLAQRLDQPDLFVITSGPNIALELVKNRPDYTVNLVGGQLNRESLSVSGPGSLEFIDQFNLDLAIMTASGFSPSCGFTCGSYSECALKKRVAEKARTVIMLMDSSKEGIILPYTFAEKNISTLISDGGLSDSAKEFMCGINIV